MYLFIPVFSSVRCTGWAMGPDMELLNYDSLCMYYSLLFATCSDICIWCLSALDHLDVELPCVVLRRTATNEIDGLY